MHIHVPSMYLAGRKLDFVDEQKYLGVYICSDMSDVRDMKRQLRAIYARGNMLIRKFSNCSTDVKMELFRSLLNSFNCIDKNVCTKYSTKI